MGSQDSVPFDVVCRYVRKEEDTYGYNWVEFVNEMIISRPLL
jgi:hypothetical protein